MSQVLAVSFTVFLVSVLVSVFYWQVVRRVLMKALLFRLFARRDDLRWLGITDQEKPYAFAYRTLEEFICATIAFAPMISLGSFLSFLAKTRKIDHKSEAYRRFKQEASPRLNQLREYTGQYALFMMMINSPILTFSAFLIAVILWVCGKANKMMLLDKTESFVVQNPSVSNGAFQAA